MRARRLLEQRPLAPLLRGELTAAVIRQRDSSPTARLAGPALQAQAGGDLGALTNMLLKPADAPTESAETRLACFNRAIATRPVNEG